MRPRELTTQRLRLTPISEQDLPFLIELDGDPEVMRHLTGRARTPREARDFWAPQIPGPQWIGHLDGHPVGWWAVWPSEGGIAEIGYRLARRVWRQGLAVEGARAVVDAAFADPALRVVRAETMVVNDASRGVMRRLGMHEVRVEVRQWDEPLPGAELGEVIAEVTRQEWSSTPE
ncbi:MAG: GNAT family N-acetyltransferase [Janibacter sp.]